MNSDERIEEAIAWSLCAAAVVLAVLALLYLAAMVSVYF